MAMSVLLMAQPLPVFARLGKVLTLECQGIMQLSSAPCHRWYLNYVSPSQGTCPSHMSSLPASGTHSEFQRARRDRVAKLEKSSGALSSRTEHRKSGLFLPLLPDLFLFTNHEGNEKVLELQRFPFITSGCPSTKCLFSPLARTDHY